MTAYSVQLWDLRWNPERSEMETDPYVIGFIVEAESAEDALTKAIDLATEAYGATIASSEPAVHNMATGEQEIG